MYSFQRVSFSCPELDDVQRRFRETADFESHFFRADDPDPRYPRFDRGADVILSEVLSSGYLGDVFPKLLPLDISALKYSMLDRLEYEGSFASLLIRGTCTRSIAKDEDDARMVARSICAEAFSAGGDLVAFRFDDAHWSSFTREATISATYISYAPSLQLWWFLCFADFY